MNIIIADTCCLLNIYASGSVQDILRGVPYQMAVSSIVAHSELLYMMQDHNKIRLTLDNEIQAGLIQLIDSMSDDELIAYTTYSAELDDGEAATGAIAGNRNWGIATDDRKARRVFSQTLPHIRLFTTAELMRLYYDRGNISEMQLAAIITRIRTSARFSPAKDDPLRSWWMDYEKS